MTVAHGPGVNPETVPDTVLHAVQETVLQSAWLKLPGSRNNVHHKVEILEITDASVLRPPVPATDVEPAWTPVGPVIPE